MSIDVDSINWRYGSNTLFQNSGLTALQKLFPVDDPGHAQVHAGDNSRMNESRFVMAEAYKKNQQGRKHTRSIRNIHTNNMQEFEPIYYFCSMKDGGIR